MHGLAHISLAFLLSLFFDLDPLLVILGSLLPDIDSPFTMIGRLFPWLSYRLNEEFDLSLKEQKYHLMFSSLEKYRERIEKMIGDKGYEEAVLEVDEFVRNLPKT
ncbi:hypothetical protein DRN62_04085 [Nanoarchaeota archaeon]|nr:MAG: hypothetical protein DRN62_04085 [Nanoarchaeota archaeon]